MLCQSAGKLPAASSSARRSRQAIDGFLWGGAAFSRLESMARALQEIEHSGGGMLLQTVTWTILLSVVLHGISAPPLAARYWASIAKAGNIPEKAPAGEPRVRLHDLAGRHSLRGQQARGTTSTATGEPTAGMRPS
jgi:hypothetical protein